MATRTKLDSDEPGKINASLAEPIDEVLAPRHALIGTQGGHRVARQMAIPLSTAGEKHSLQR